MPFASVHRAVSLVVLASSCAGFKLRQAPAPADDALVVHARKPIWVHAYARSGSSTVLSMVSQAHAGEPSSDSMFLASVGKAADKVGRVFSLFEPCHLADEMDEELQPKGCNGLLISLARCEFQHIRSLHGWTDPHSRTRGVMPYEPELASKACRGADVVTFKTISRAGEIFDFETDGLPVLNAEHALKMIDIVRDPRDIFSSWMSTWPFNDTKLKSGVQRNPGFLVKLCKSFAAATSERHPRTHRIVFENLVQKPMEVMESVFNFMEVPFGNAQRQWVKETFDAQDCPGVNEFVAPYSDCHTNASSSLEKWRSVLYEEEKAVFREHPACQKVAEDYGYKLL